MENAGCQGDCQSCPERSGQSGEQDTENSIVCFCYKLTTGKLKKAYRELGSLKAVEEATRAGTGCSGCKVVLHSLFGEAPSEHNIIDVDSSVGTSCVKPGARTMTGFVVSDGQLESTVYSSNAVAPQLGDCDSTTVVNYALVDHRGYPVLERTETIATNATFCFDTRGENLPKPFYGMFMLTFNRSNYGASRFNIYWSNGESTTSTHENSSTGRLRVFVPLIIEERFLRAENTIYMALMNPHAERLPFQIAVYDVDSGDELSWDSELQPRGSTWINANEFLYGPALRKFPKGRFVARVLTSSGDVHRAITVYFFIHNRKTNTWTCNHL